jgi:hypothetical protein
MIHRTTLSISLLLLGVLVSTSAGAPVVWDKPTISTDTTWSGEVLIRENVVVSPGATLRILPGTSVKVESGKGIGLTVLGRLLVEGREGGSVSFIPEKKDGAAAWDGIRLLGGKSAGHVLSGFRIEGAREAVSLAETSARFSDGVFASCRVGILGNQKSLAAVDNCLFDGNGAGAVVSLGAEGVFRRCRVVNISGTGIVVDKGGALRVSGCTFNRGKTGILSFTNSPCKVDDSAFLSLENGIVARQMGEDSSISRCSFENDNTGISAVQFCAVEIADSRFRGNVTGVDAREFSTPKILHNRFEANQAAVNLFRKSHAVIERNVFLHNRDAVVVNYSSYPLIRGNDFDRNDMSVRLERYQSGDWEEREGSTNLSGAEAAMRGSRNPGLKELNVKFPRRVMARGNYWGPDAGRDPVKGTMGKVRDGKAFGPVRYEGYGDKEYAIDVVDFGEEAPSPIPDAGPRVAGAGEAR